MGKKKKGLSSCEAGSKAHRRGGEAGEKEVRDEKRDRGAPNGGSD